MPPRARQQGCPEGGQVAAQGQPGCDEYSMQGLWKTLHITWQFCSFLSASISIFVCLSFNLITHIFGLVSISLLLATHVSFARVFVLFSSKNERYCHCHGTSLSQVCMNTFLCTAKRPMLAEHSGAKHPKHTFEQCFPNFSD